MPDPKQTVEHIRSILHDGVIDESIDIATIAIDFAEFCREANFRLRRCADFLRDGLLGETVDLAGGRPPLLEFVSALEFPEFAEWEQKCFTLGLARPGHLAQDILPNLKQAFDDFAPLRELLAKYRYLALARASLADRLAILRQLIAADPKNSGWKRDAEELERARLADLRNEAAAAVRAGDAAGVGKLLAELNSGPWQTPVPDELKTTLTQASAALYQSTAIDQLRGLVPGIRDALATRSLEQSQQVFAQWARVVKNAKIPVPPELRQEIAPLGQWLDDQEDLRERERDFRIACDTLAATIKTHAPLELLSRRYREAAGFSMEIPVDLSSLYRRELQMAQRQQRGEKRKQFALAATLVGAIVLALAALGYVIFGSGKI